MIIVSACLANINCRYDGGTKPCEMVIRLVTEGKAIPVCPEQLGGLTTPRLPAERQGKRVIRKDGVDLTMEFDRGAQEAFKIVKLVGAKSVILKARSPSCGFGRIYDGSFTGRLVDGDGVFAKLCIDNRIYVSSELDI
jgi:uncharacterized protein YbbK (DUF523 family)